MTFSLKPIKSLIAATIAVGLYTQPSTAKDAFGLDAYKRSVDSITEAKVPYKTRFNNAINVYTVPPKSQAKGEQIARFLVQGGLHGNELLASEFVAWLAQRFARGDSSLNNLNGGKIEIDFVPYANPDGTILFTRYNGNHINLNRNFGVLWGITKENPGKSAFSEVESRAIRDLIDKRNYAGAVDVHGYVNWIVAPTSPKDAIKGLPEHQHKKISAYNRWYKALANEVKANLPGYELKTAGALGDGGSFEDYAWWGAGVPAFCLEAFSDERFVATSVASKLVDLVTPKFFMKPQASEGRSDMFLVYENFIRNMFDEALKLQGDDTPKIQYALTK